MTFPVFVHYGIELWVPEIGGKVDPGSDAHDLVMSLFGGMSKGERNRIKIRVRAAMAAQAEHEGRFLGGRPPYGYVLADVVLTPIQGRLPTVSVFTGSESTQSDRQSSREISCVGGRVPLPLHPSRP